MSFYGSIPHTKTYDELPVKEYYRNRLTGDVMSVRFAEYRPNKVLWKRISEEEYLPLHEIQSKIEKKGKKHG